MPLEIPSQHYLLPPLLFPDADLKNQTKGNTAGLVKETYSGKEMGTGGFFIGPGGAGTSRTHCVMYGGIIKKAVLKDLECEAREWKPDSIWHKK